MSSRLRFGPRRPRAAWLLILVGWLSLATTVVGVPLSGQSARPAAQYWVRRAEITLSVPDVERAVTALEELARTVRGRFVGNRIQVYVPANGQREVEATLELPPELLDTALARLRGMALTVLSEESRSRDVGSQVSELNRHLEGLRATRRQLRELMDRADTDSERRQVETALSQAEDEIAEAEGTLAALRQEVDWAAIHILIYEAPPTATPPPSPMPSLILTATAAPIMPSPTPWRPGETVRRATSVLVSIVRELTDVLIVATIVGGPFLILALAGWWIRGRVRR